MKQTNKMRQKSPFKCWNKIDGVQGAINISFGIDAYFFFIYISSGYLAGHRSAKLQSQQIGGITILN